MGNWKFRTVLRSLLIGCIVLVATHLGFARGGNVLRTQGLINPGGDPKAGYLVINETKVYIDKTTQLMDHREIPILITELTPKRWVYMEVEKNPDKNTLKARKIYLLPYYVKPEERRKFTFMK